MVKDPFAFHHIVLSLRLDELDILIRLLMQSNPAGNREEGLIVQLVSGLKETKNKIENE